MRLLGITLPDEKRLEVALTTVYGIGLSRSQEILDELNIDKDKKAKDVSSEEEGKIRDLIEKFTLEGDLKREVSGNVKKPIHEQFEETLEKLWDLVEEQQKKLRIFLIHIKLNHGKEKNYKQRG
jgi:hypothetical protein